MKDIDAALSRYDTRRVRTDPIVSTSALYGPDLWTDVNAFHRHLSSYDYLDVATYSLARVYGFTVRRLIYHVSNDPGIARFCAREARRADHFHVKLYLAWLDDRCVAAFTGSLNLIQTRSTELMVRVSRHAALRKWFDEAWKSLEP